MALSRPVELAATDTVGFADMLGSTTTVRHTDITSAAGWRPVEKAWQSDGWGYYDLLGEVHYAVNIGGNIATRLDINVEHRDDHSGRWRPDRSNRTACTIAELVESQGADWMLRSAWVNWQIAGEGLLGVHRDNQNVTGVGHYSLTELRPGTASGEWTLDYGPELGVPPQAYHGSVYRTWRPHGRYQMAPDSALRAALTDCKELHLLKLAILARITSRLASQGILFIPNNVNVSAMPADVKALGTSLDNVGLAFMALFAQVLRDPGSASAAAPVIIRGEPGAADAIKHIVMETTVYEQEMREREELRKSIANAIELPVQTQTTEGEASPNHWGMWAIDEQALSNHVVPLSRGIMRIVTERVLWPALRISGMSEMEARSWRLGIDPTRAAQAANRFEQAKIAKEMNLIGDATARRVFGFAEADAPTAAETLRWIGLKMNNPLLGAHDVAGITPQQLEVLVNAVKQVGARGPGGYNASETRASISAPAGSDATKGLDGS